MDEKALKRANRLAGAARRRFAGFFARETLGNHDFNMQQNMKMLDFLGGMLVYAGRIDST